MDEQTVTSSRAMVIGYGNLLRSDDGVACHLIELLSEFENSATECRAFPQLDAALAEDLRDVSLAIFVDARRDDSPEPVVVSEIQPYEGTLHPGHLSHISSPQVMLAITKSLYGKSPKAFLVAIKGYNFEIGEQLSAKCSEALPTAVAEIRRLLQNQ